MNPLMKNYMDQEWTIAFGSDMWRQVFENGLQEFDKLKSFGSQKNRGYSQEKKLERKNYKALRGYSL